MKISLRVSELLSGHYFHSELFEGTLFCKNKGVIKVRILCTLSDDALCLYQYRENISKGFRVIERTKFHREIFKGAYLNKNYRWSFSSCCLHIMV